MSARPACPRFLGMVLLLVGCHGESNPGGPADQGGARPPDQEVVRDAGDDLEPGDHDLGPARDQGSATDVHGERLDLRPGADGPDGAPDLQPEGDGPDASDLPPLDQGGGTGALEGLALRIGAADLTGTLVQVAGLDFSCLTDASGAFRLVDVPIGSYAVVATYPGFATARASDVQVVAGQTAQVPHLRLAPLPGAVLGTATRGGAPAGGHGGILLAIAGTDCQTTTADSGAFPLGSAVCVPPGRHVLSATAAGYFPAASDPFDLGPGETRALPPLLLVPDLDGDGRAPAPWGSDCDDRNSAVWLPACGDRQCGDDGCGGSCGSCPDYHRCVDGHCQCFPDCRGSTSCALGADGCGGSCQDCVAGHVCVGAVCVCPAGQRECQGSCQLPNACGGCSALPVAGSAAGDCLVYQGCASPEARLVVSACTPGQCCVGGVCRSWLRREDNHVILYEDVNYGGGQWVSGSTWNDNDFSNDTFDDGTGLNDEASSLKIRISECLTFWLAEDSSQQGDKIIITGNNGWIEIPDLHRVPSTDRIARDGFPDNFNDVASSLSWIQTGSDCFCP